jgi:predicted glycoside hydrolase/deacetylase ChbG (UPF0249 family)
LAPAATVAAVTSLTEALRYGPDATLLVVACDDLGLSYSSNIGVYDALRSGMATTAGLMVPCPWSREAASRYRGEDVGVHLTLNCEFDVYRWGPITQAPSLLDGDGGFPRTLDDLWDHADVEEVRRECRAQIERAILWGFDVSHLSSHLGALEFRPEFFDVALELCVEFGLPMRLSPSSAERSIGFPFRQLAAEEGVTSPDNLLRSRNRGARSALDRLLAEVVPGVTEIVLRPAIDTGELRSLAPDWASRVDDHDVVTAGVQLRALVDRARVTLIGYRELRDLQRSTRRRTDDGC